MGEPGMRLKILKTGLILVSILLFVNADAATGAKRIYYSIHFASFKNLANANRQVNALTEKGKMVFWKKTDVPGKGIYYRVYLGRYKNREDAVAFWEKLNKIGAVSYFGIHRFTESVQPSKIKDVRKLDKPSSYDVDQAKQRVPVRRGRFADNLDGTVTDTKTNLMWIKNGWRIDFFAAETWAEASKKCENFRHGGFNNWRLPTIAEWRSVIDPQKENPALVEPNPFVNIVGHMPYWTQTEFTYGRDHTCSKKCPLESYTVMLYSGTINHQKKTARAFILPVRSITPDSS